MLYNEFYAEVGKLLYAIANTDGVISQKEKQSLRDIVKKELVTAEKHKDRFKTNAAFYAEMEFDFLDEEIIDPEEAFESFTGFVEDHYQAFDDNMKDVCLRITKELANAYRHTNRKEKELIEHLERKLDKLELKQLKQKK